MNKKSLLCLLHLPVWAIAILAAWFFGSDDVPAGVPNYVLFSTIITSIWFLAGFYTFYCWLVPKFLMKGQCMTFWLYTALTVIIIIPLIVLALMQITHIAALTLPESLSVKGLRPWLGTIAITAICGTMGTLFRYLTDWFRNSRIK